MSAMEIDGGPESKALFAQVQFYIVLTDEIDEEKAEAVSLKTACTRFCTNHCISVCEATPRVRRARSTTSTFRE